MPYTIESLNRLTESLDATGVLSKEYASRVISMALSAVSEAVEMERKRAKPAPRTLGAFYVGDLVEDNDGDKAIVTGAALTGEDWTIQVTWDCTGHGGMWLDAEGFTNLTERVLGEAHAADRDERFRRQ